jgi:hypothetical protein
VNSVWVERGEPYACADGRMLAAEFPSRPQFRQELALSHNNRGNLLYTAGRLTEAEKDWNGPLSIQEELAADFPNQPEVRNDVAGTCVNLAFFHTQQRNWAAARRLLREGRPHHLAGLKANPRHPDYRRFYRNHLAVLTMVHAGLLEQQDARRLRPGIPRGCGLEWASVCKATSRGDRHARYSLARPVSYARPCPVSGGALHCR